MCSEEKHSSHHREVSAIKKCPILNATVFARKALKAAGFKHEMKYENAIPFSVKQSNHIFRTNCDKQSVYERRGAPAKIFDTKVSIGELKGVGGRGAD